MVLEDWNWYTKLVGARFASEIETLPTRLQIINTKHLSTWWQCQVRVSG